MLIILILCLVVTSILGWGAGLGIGSDSIQDILLQVQRANVAMLDRWKISFDSQTTSKKDNKADVIFNNYFGIGTSVC